MAVKVHHSAVATKFLCAQQEEEFMIDAQGPVSNLAQQKMSADFSRTHEMPSRGQSLVRRLVSQVALSQGQNVMRKVELNQDLGPARALYRKSTGQQSALASAAAPVAQSDNKESHVS